jgi:N-acetylglutamate synthase-like GNAT family acetyltransferase
MIRRCTGTEVPAIFSIINDAAMAYKGVIPEDRWHEPYMPLAELQGEISRGVNFWGSTHDGALTGVMGIQDVRDVTLMRHAYVKPGMQHHGIGTELLSHLKKLAHRPLLVGTWKAASWAVDFYIKNGFTLVTDKEKNELLKKYWTIPDRQIETSVVLADQRWLSLNKR